MKQNAAVLTGDIIGSEQLAPDLRQQLSAQLQQALDELRHWLPDWQSAIFQGDSFQGFTVMYREQLFEAMAMLWCNLFAKGYDCRMAIGLGTMDHHTGSTLTSGGTAFVLSGRSLANLKESSLKLAVIQENEDRNAEWRVHATALHFLQERTSQPQAEAMALAWQKHQQAQIAAILGIRQPAVQQRLKAAGYPVWMAMAQRYRQLFKG
jgi:hypothetical protein